jgi:hypothetical protein
VKALLEHPAAALLDADAMLQLLQAAVAHAAGQQCSDTAVAAAEQMVAALVACPAMSQVRAGLYLHSTASCCVAHLVSVWAESLTLVELWYSTGHSHMHMLLLAAEPEIRQLSVCDWKTTCQLRS